MKNTSRKPYVYKVTNCENHQYYIGSQCSGKTIGVNYFTSSTNKEFKNGFKTYREEKYEITIIKEFEDPKKCVHVENYIIRNYMQLKDGLCLNRFYCCNGEKIFSTVGIHPSEETKQKLRKAHKGTHLSEETRKRISEAQKGRPSPHKGIHHSEETKKKISTALKGIPRSEETRKKMSVALKGIPLTEETRKKMSEAKKGIHHSDEARKKMSEAHKGYPSPNRIKISIENVTFDSLTEAAQYYNVSKSTISCWLKNQKHSAVYIEKCPKI